MRTKDKERLEAIAKLREWIKPGDTLHTVVRSVARSGMSRTMDVYQLHNGDADYLTRYVGKALGVGFDKSGDHLRIHGCGMDMGFHVVNELGYVLFPEGFECIGKGCPSNDHFNGDRDYSPHHHKAGGYALRQRWL